MSSRFVTAFAAILVIAGCGQKVRGPVRICPGKGSAAEAVAVLAGRAERAVSIRANGQCRLKYYVEDKEHKENFAVKLWVNPPSEIYLQGDVAFDATGIVLGANAEEFWFWVKLKEVSSYWYGRWSQCRRGDELMISPKVVLEALGVVCIDGFEWDLSNSGGFDILTGRKKEGTAVKRIYISTCEYLISKIEYFDGDGEVVVSAETENYVEVAEGFYAAKMIKVISGGGGEKEDSVRIMLGSVKAAEFNAKQRARLFVRPKPRGFEHVYQIIEGLPVEQAGR